VKSITSNLTDKVVDDERQVVVCDINPDMLSVGRGRVASAVGTTTSKLIGFVEGNAEKLPFRDQSFDLYTIAFGLRNVTNKDVALKEAYRVLKPGGRIMIMEFSSLKNPMLQQMYDGYSFNVIPKIGELVANDRESYQYLVESIRKFPKQEELLGMVRSAGFGCASYRNLTFGVVAVHSGFKL
jgi:ubiquinone/menaquinone biosynthesis methyltransferase